MLLAACLKYTPIISLILCAILPIDRVKAEYAGSNKRRPTKDGRPEKIDLTFIVDESERMGEENLRNSVKIILKLLKHFSISPGTTRVGLYTVGNKWKKHFEFRDHVNRECLMKSLKKIIFKLRGSNREKYVHFLRTGLAKLKEKHTDIEGQRRIYLYLTNNADDKKLLEGELELNLEDEFTILLFEEEHASDVGTTNATKKLNIASVSKQIRLLSLPVSTDHILYKLNVENKQYGICKNRTTEKQEGEQEIRRVKDECDRHCECHDGKLTNCFRLRREFTSMTSAERRRYLKAYKTLTTKSPYKETYERFIFMHYKYFCWGIHTRDLFLPWHRWLLSIMEDLLRQIDCGVTIPYWDWSYVSEDPWNRTNLWRSSDDGLGKSLPQIK